MGLRLPGEGRSQVLPQELGIGEDGAQRSFQVVASLEGVAPELADSVFQGLDSSQQLSEVVPGCEAHARFVLRKEGRDRP